MTACRRRVVRLSPAVCYVSLSEKELKCVAKGRNMEGIVDIHCHILPDVDDGAASLEETAQLLRMEYEDGVRSIIVTPHYRRNMFETEMSRIQEAYRMTCEKAAELAEDLRLYLGCEFHVNMEMEELLKQGERPTLAGSRYVLAEFSGGSDYGYLRERVQCLRFCGYKPILAHIERCECLRKTTDRVEELVEMGALIQVNAGSILGEEGYSSKLFCRKLMKMELIHYIGSDTHGVRTRTPNLGKCAAFLEKKMGSDYARKILCENPKKIMQEGNTVR